jgi:hypothetical protein
MSAESNAVVRFETQLREEQRKTTECLADIQQFLSRDTSKTRGELARVLREQAALIQAGVETDIFFEGCL